MSALTELIRAAEATVELAENGITSSPPITIPSWEERSGELQAKVVFGPYPQRVSADSVLLRLNGEVEPVKLTGRVSLPPGVRFTYDLSIRVTRGLSA